METRLIVSDTSPIRALCSVGYEDLLPRLFGEICVPEAVAMELRNPAGPSSAIDPATLPFISVVRVATTPLLLQLNSALDPGEAEAIAYASQLNSKTHKTLLLIDEAAGRTPATGLGLIVMGTVGLLIDAKRKHLLPAIRPVIDQMRRDFRFFLSEPFLKSNPSEGW